MIRIDIRPVWRFRSETEKEFDFMLIALLEAIKRTGKLTRSAEQAGISYRHAWNLIEQWQEFFGAPLVVMKQGRGTELTALGANLLWAGQRARERLAPELDNLASEFASALNASLSDASAGLAIHASHDFAIAGLRDITAPAGLSLDVQYRGSFDALAALRRGECDVAGFHLPEGPLNALTARRYAECLPPGAYCLVDFATRTQGFIVGAGNPKRIRGIADLTRPDVRMVNRQRGSGTRALLEFMISHEAIDRALIRGYDTEEITHAAVAALIAGKQADVGFGVQAAAAQYHLDFVPYCTERYYLACSEERIDAPPVRALLEALRGPAFRDLIASLPGYSSPDAGRVLKNSDVLATMTAEAVD
jgi:molybdate transport repressor ModE-like protein